VTDQVVRQLSDGEELVIEGLPARNVVDPREKTIEVRRRALVDDKDDRPRLGPSPQP
jgi:hypothetical protein